MPADLPTSDTAAGPPVWYQRWAERYYQRLDEPHRSEARRIDAYLCSRRAWRVWLALLVAELAGASGLQALGMPFGLALFICGVLSLSLISLLGSAWLRPQQFTAPRLGRWAVMLPLWVVAGLLTGFVAGRWLRHGSLVLDELPSRVLAMLREVGPALLLAVLALLLLSAGIAQYRRHQLEQALAQAQLAQALQTGARQAAEGRLRLLQAQIQPHFIFNTLAALQHWVDAGDPRAAGLLRALSGFLRGSTELLSRDEVTLAEEWALVQHYLAIMQARLGPRLALDLQAEPAALQQPLPPGLLLTLVENAVEHGVSPALRPVTLRLRAALAGPHFQLSVQDDGPGLAPDWQPGTGLSNLRERLQHRFGESASLELLDGAPGTRAQLQIRAD